MPAVKNVGEPCEASASLPRLMSAASDYPLGLSGPSWRSQAITTAMAAAGAAGLGAVSGGLSSTAAAAVAGGLLLGALMARAPTAIFALSLLLLAYSPEYVGSALGIFAHPQFQKGLLYFVIVGFMFRRGVRPLGLLILVAYAGEAILAYLHATLIPGLTPGQSAASFVTLTVGWATLMVKWRYPDDLWFLRVIAVLPIVCLILGFILQAAGIRGFLEHGTGFDTTTRLAGAAIPAELSLTCLVASFAAMLCYRLTRWTPALPLMIVNALILELTLTRGGAIALGIAMVFPAARLALSRRPGQRLPQWLRVGMVGAVVAAVIAVALPALLSRASTGVFIQGQGVVHNSTSGRSKAWSEFYAIAKGSPLFGHGLGAGPITHIQQQGFLNQHNEYLRLFLEGGYVGGGMVMLAIVIVIAICILRSPRMIRLDLLGFMLGFSVYSYTDNTFSSPNLTVPLGLMLGICASWSLSPRPSLLAAPSRTGAWQPAPAVS